MIDAMTIGMSALYAIGWGIFTSKIARELDELIDKKEDEEGLVTQVEVLGGDRKVVWDAYFLVTLVFAFVLWPIWAITYPIALAKRKKPRS